MKKTAKVINQETKECAVFTGTDINWAISQGFSELEVEGAYNGVCYLQGFAPRYVDTRTYYEKRAVEYPAIGEQLDMIYWDKINNTDTWQQTIAAVKAKYPKEAAENAENTAYNNSSVSNV